MSIFILTPRKVKELTRATFFEGEEEIQSVKLERVDDAHYVTDNSEIPNQLFKIKVDITDFGGYKTTKVVSKDIQSVTLAKKSGNWTDFLDYSNFTYLLDPQPNLLNKTRRNCLNC